MRHPCVVFLISCLFVVRAPAQQGSDTTNALRRSPDFRFVTFDGHTIRSDNLKGKVIVLDFWSTDCNPCRRSMPQLEEFYQRYKNDPRVALYVVNSGWEPYSKAKAFADAKRSSLLFIAWGKPYDLPFAYDSASITLKAFGFRANPSTVIIDRHFRVRFKHSAYVEKLNDFLTQHVEGYLAER